MYIFWKPSLRKLEKYHSLNTLLVSGLVDKRKNHKIVSLEIRKYYCSLSQYFFGCSKSKADNGNCAVIGAVFFPNEKMFWVMYFLGRVEISRYMDDQKVGSMTIRWKRHHFFMNKLAGVRMGVVVGLKTKVIKRHK